MLGVYRLDITDWKHERGFITRNKHEYLVLTKCPFLNILATTHSAS
jgi:hypothetical protein